MKLKLAFLAFIVASLVLLSAPLVHARSALVRVTDPASAIVGSWTTPDNKIVITFLSSGAYLLADITPDDQMDECGHKGMEQGTYTWNAMTGVFTAQSAIDTNGCWGLTDPALSSGGTATAQVSNDILTLSDSSGSWPFSRVADQNKAIVGGWFDSNSASKNVYTFTSNGFYFHAQRGQVNDSGGWTGVEGGTYTWDAESGAFTSQALVDTNGSWGLSSNSPDAVTTYSVIGNALTRGESVSAFAGSLALYDDFSSGTVDAARWLSDTTGGTISVVNNALEIVSNVSGTVSNNTRVLIASQGDFSAVSADVTITNYQVSGGYHLARMTGSLYNDGTPENTAGSQLGDILSGFIITDTEISYSVLRCLTSNCSSWQYLTGNGSNEGRVYLADNAIGQKHTLFTQWDGNVVTFQVDSNPPAIFDPKPLAPIVKSTPNKPLGFMGVRHIENGDQSGSVTAVFDNVRHGAAVDIIPTASTNVWKTSFAGTLFNSDSRPNETTYLTLITSKSGTFLSGTLGFQDTLGRSGSTAISGSMDNNTIAFQFTDMDQACASRTIATSGVKAGNTLSLMLSAPMGGSCQAYENSPIKFTLATTSTYTASGTYSYISSSQTMTILWTSSNWNKKGPQPGGSPEQQTGISVTETSTNALHATWSRTSGSADDITGIWTITDPISGNIFQATFNYEGTLTLVGHIAFDEQAQLADGWSDYSSGSFSGNPRYKDPDHNATSVTVTGPNISVPLELTYNMDRGEWDAFLPPSSSVQYGDTHSSAPLTYNFAIATAAGTRYDTGRIECFIEQLPMDISVTGNGTPVFNWTKLPDPYSNMRYNVQIQHDPNPSLPGTWMWENEQVDVSSIAYDGPALVPGNYSYLLSVHPGGSLDCETLNWGAFTVTSGGTGTNGSEYTAAGDFSYDSFSGNLTLNWATSDFPGCGPEIGIKEEVVSSITATSLSLVSGQLWTRLTGTAANLIGSWIMIDGSTGNTYQITFNENGAVSVLGSIVSCNSGPSASGSISGTLSYSGSNTGRIYINVNPAGGGNTAWGTSIASAGTFTIRGLSPGNYRLSAWMDTLDTGTRNASNPTGSSDMFSLSSESSLTGLSILLTDPAPVEPAAPTGFNVFPGEQSAFISWNQQTVEGSEVATSYKVYWGTDTDASNLGYMTFFANNNGFAVQSGLTNSAEYYYKIAALAGNAESPASEIVGPITIGAPMGQYTISGVISIPTTTISGPLYVGVYGDNGIFYSAIASPTSIQTYTVTGVPNGSYGAFAFVDMNNNGLSDADDMTICINNGNCPSIAIENGNIEQNLAFSSANALASVATAHMKNGMNESYNLIVALSREAKRPVKATITSGPNLNIPTDLGLNWGGFSGWFGSGLRPITGETYSFAVTYSDNTTETFSSSITAVLDSFATLSSPIGPVQFSATPTFTWKAPLTPPAGPYTYILSVNEGSAWSSNPLASSQLSAVYNADGRANQPTLENGLSYSWNIAVRDGNGNMAINTDHFSFASTISGIITNQSSTVLSDISAKVYDANTGNQIAEAMTDMSGHYSLDGLSAGSYKVCFGHARLYGYLPECYNDKPFASTDNILSADTVTLGNGQSVIINAQLAFGGGISGRVTDGEAGIIGVEVRLYDSNGNRLTWTGATAVTDGTGNYSIGGLSDGEYKICFNSSDAGYASQCYNTKSYNPSEADTVTVTAPATHSGIDAILVQSAGISGRVTYGLTGIPNIRVSVCRYDSVAGYCDWGFNSVNTNASGYYTLSGLPDGQYRVQFYGSNQGYATGWYHNATDVNASSTVNITAGTTLNGIDEQLVAGGTVSGRVTDDAGAGLANAEVWAELNGSWAGGSNTDPQGYYSLVAAPGTYKINFSVFQPADYYMPEWIGSVPVSVGQNTSGINAQLKRLDAQITGTVTEYGTGNPIPGAIINASTLDGRWITTSVSSYGTYSLTVLTNTEWNIGANEPEGYFGMFIPENNYSASIITIPTNSVPMTINFIAHKETAWIEGTVKDEHGVNVVEGALFYANRVNTNDPELRRLSNGHYTNASGKVTVGLEPGSWRAGLCMNCHDHPVFVNGVSRELVASGEFDVPDLTVGEHRQVEINAYYADGALEGTVYREDGVTPVPANIRINAWTDSALNGLSQTSVGAISTAAETDENGHFRLPLLGGSWNINVVMTEWNRQSSTQTIALTTNGDEVIDPNEVMYGVNLVLNLPVNATITASSNGHGTISPASQSVVYGNTASLELAPDPGYSIASVGGSCGGTLNGSTYTTNTIISDCTVTANFALPVVSYNLSGAVSGGHGWITPVSQSIVSGGTGTVAAYEDPGYHIASFTSTCGGARTQGYKYIAGPLTADCLVTVTFEMNSLTITTSGTGSGTVLSSPTSTLGLSCGAGCSGYNTKTIVTLTAIPNSGSNFTNWSGNCIGTNPTTTISAVGPRTCAAVFSLKTYTVSAITGTNGSLDAATHSPAIVTHGSSTQFKFNAASGYHVASISGCFAATHTNSSSAETTFTYVTGPITSACTVSAQFAVNPVYTSTITPTAWAFGNQVITTISTAHTVTLKNTGNVRLVINSIGLSGMDSSQFTQTSLCPISGTGLAVNASCTISIAFSPTTSGPKNASLDINVATPGVSKSVALTGIGTTPIATVMPATLPSFGKQLISTVSLTKTIAVANTGTAPMMILSTGISGTNLTDFACTSTCPVGGAVLATGETCTISVTFKPASTGVKNASLAVIVAAPATTKIIALNGTGTAPIATVTPITLPSYGNQLINTVSTAKAVKVTNTGSALLFLSTGITGSNPGQFTQASTCPTGTAGLATGSSCTISVTFKPTATGLKTASLAISTEAPAVSKTVALSGTGTIPVATVNPAVLSFGTQTNNSISAARAVKVTNTGSAPLFFSTSVTGSNPGQFAQTSTCPTGTAGLATGASCTISVTFKPTAAGLKTASLAITTAAPAVSKSVALSGTGTLPVATVLPALLSFGTLSINSTSAAKAVTVTNTGTGTLVILSTGITGTNTGAFSQTSTCPIGGSGLVTNATCTISVTFNPKTVGANSASLAVNVAAPAASKTVKLSGTGK